MVGKPCHFPSSLSSFSWPFLKGRIYEVWHQCDGFICHSWIGVVMKWVTDTRESGRSRDMALHFIERGVFEVHVGLKHCDFVYRQASTRPCQRYKRFIDPIYRASTWPSQSIYYVAQEATRLVWMNFSVLPQRSNSINMIKLLNSPALKNLALDEWICKINECRR